MELNQMEPFKVLASVGAGVSALAWLYNSNKSDASIHVINTSEECRKIVDVLRSHCGRFPVLGFNCEWEQKDSYRKKVALLELACDGGVCALVKLHEIKDIPIELYTLMKDPSVLKVGFEPHNNAYKLWADYFISVQGTLDLSVMAKCCNINYTINLAELARELLDKEIPNKHLSDSNWNQPILDDDQIKYAAEVARVSFQLYVKLGEIITPRSIWNSRRNWNNSLRLKFSNDIIYSNKYNRSGECKIVASDLSNPLIE